MNLAYYSSLALVTSVVVYLLAMIAYAAEWAAARKAPVEDVGRPAGAGRRRAAARSASPPTPAATGPQRRPPTGRHGRAVEQRMAECRSSMLGRIGVALTVLGFVLQRRRRGAARPGRRPCAVGQHVRVHHHRDGVRRRWSTWCGAGELGLRWLGLPVTLLAAVGNGLAVTVFYVAVAPLVPALHSVWFVIHIVAAAISGAAFNVGGLARSCCT